ncbi:putative ATX1-antioxidant protein and metal homeostasis factor, partial [Hygrophoropsis aurantiaca]
MTCGGCSGAVTKALNKLKEGGGISDFDVSLENQKVVVKGTAPYETVLEKIKKTGKQVRKVTV